MVFILDLLVVVSLSPVRGPGPRASRLSAISETWGARTNVAVLLDAAHEDVELSRAAVRGASMRCWLVPPPQKSFKFAQLHVYRFALGRAAREFPGLSDGGEASAAAPTINWFVWANDHTFLIVENLHCYLSTLDARMPHYAGQRMWGPCCGSFNSGAAGFAISASAAKSLAFEWRRANQTESCDVGDKKSHVARCLKNSIGLSPRDTRDATGAERFNAYGPVRLATGAVDDWFVKKKAQLSPPEAVLRGPAGVSAGVATFHYVAAAECRLLDRLLHRPWEWRLDPLALEAEWPEGRTELGGYSHAWPAKDQEKQMKIAALLEKIEICGAPDEPAARRAAP
ncbi:hypothetical protein M885DRAFT_530795 [Pelagophyceae sp. CCMP2097]|nr:hypothetical protein M885DRAFT_530795 [Pelagophyceae sp. CCMP2097]